MPYSVSSERHRQCGINELALYFACVTSPTGVETFESDAPSCWQQATEDLAEHMLNLMGNDPQDMDHHDRLRTIIYEEVSLNH